MTTRHVAHLAALAVLAGCVDSHASTDGGARDGGDRDAATDGIAGTRRFRGHVRVGWEYGWIRECGRTEWWILGGDPLHPPAGIDLWAAHHALRLPRDEGSFVDVVATVSERGAYHGPAISSMGIEREVILVEVLDVRAPSDGDCRLEGDAGPVPPYDAGPEPLPELCNLEGACCGDYDALSAFYGPMMERGYPEVAEDCAEDCTLDADPVTCTVACLGVETMDAVSDGCEACHAAAALCGVWNCAPACLTDRGSPECVACQCGENDAMEDCVDAFVACSGIYTGRCY